MFYKIYFGEKPIFLCDQLDAEIQPYVHHDDVIFIDELNNHTVKTLLHEMTVPAVHALVFYHSSLEELKKSIFKKFKLIQAGGGLVLNGKKEVLMIFRRGKWDLPKGKLDSGETMEDCAVREVEEETGLSNVQISKPLTPTWHIYREGSSWVMKETHWYLMKINKAPALLPQAAEDITEAKWVPVKNIPLYLENTFPSVRDILSFA